MSTKIITGYTGDYNITPEDDAQIWQSFLGDDLQNCILPIGDRLGAYMPSTNQFVLKSGYFAIQGHIAKHTQEWFTVDTCPSDKKRIDLIVARYKNEDGIESIACYLIKGTETSYTPSEPSYNKGSIIDGATTVDFPMYRIIHKDAMVNFEPTIDCAVVEKGLEARLLWENASPDSNFIHQTISLSSGLTEPFTRYNKVIIVAKQHPAIPVTNAFIGENSGSSMLMSFATAYRSAVRNYFRSARIYTDGVKFEDGHYATASEDNISNDCAIPLKIYGLKGVR